MYFDVFDVFLAFSHHQKESLLTD